MTSHFHSGTAGLPKRFIIIMLFVDDSVENVRKAEQLGMSAVVITRDKSLNIDRVASIDSLERVENFIDI